ncbi:MAG: hypothetical protein O3A00_04665 [Planctomycetota bacterium]|nr:hypothetical protein [Planctomycetota bacterium]
MSDRPSVAPNVLASIVEQAPGRVRRKLDKNPSVAWDWDWQREGNAWSVSAGGETVSLTTTNGCVADDHDVRCSCLLSPRCFHAIASLAVLDVDIQTETSNDEDADAVDHDEGLATLHSLSAAERSAAELMWRNAATLLASGARAAGSLLQAHLLRAVHECRSLGLHRLAACGLRVMQNVRMLRETQPGFRGEDLVSDLTELLLVSWRIQQANESIDRQWIGVARRRFASISSLRLQGLFTEPLHTRSGYAGVVTYLLGDDGVMCSVSNVRPGTASRIQEAWQTGADIGGLTISHAELNRKAVLVQNATRSADGRLGGGQSARAVATKGDGWNAPWVAKQFAAPLEQQIDRAFALAVIPELERPVGFDFLFMNGVVEGTDGDHVLLRVGSSLIALRMAADHEAMKFRENLTMLSRAPGLAIRCIARLDVALAGRASAMAIAPGLCDPATDSAESVTLDLPDEWPNHVNLGLEELQRGHLSFAERQPVEVASSIADQPSDDGLDAARRRLRALAIGGRHSLPTGSLRDVTLEARRLEQAMQPTAAGLLLNLAKSALDSDKSFRGVRFPADPGPLAARWLACSHYEQRAGQSFERRLWQDAVRS